MQKSKKIRSRCFAALSLILCAILGFGTIAYADDSGSDSYSYDIWGNVIAAPAAYELERTVYGQDMGIGSLASASGIFYRNNNVYLIVNGSIVIADKEFTSFRSITEYTRPDGSQSAVSAPTGIYVTADDHIYICEAAQGEIVEFDENGQCVRVLGDPNCTGLTVTYQPKRLVVDDIGRIYVLVNNCYEGFVELDPEGKFNRYVGATEITYTAWDLLWRNLSTEEQKARSQLWLPTSYSDLAIDADGFIYGSVADSTTAEPVKKLNASGKDVMPVSEFGVSPMGDYENGKSVSLLNAVTVADDGRFAVLDSNRSRIFVYSTDGYLMYELAGAGNREGLVSSPVAMCFMDDKILVLDIVYGSVEIFAPTTYGALINAGLEAQSRYDYEAAANYWQQVLDINSSFYYANLGLGKYQLRNGQYEEAQQNFYLGGDRAYYSNAYAQVSSAWMDQNFGRIIGIIAALIVLCIAWKIYRKFRPAKERDTKLARFGRKLKYNMFKWPGYVLASPFKAYDDVKYYNDGSLIFSICVIIAFGWISLVQYRYTGFMVSFVDIRNVNVPMIVGSAILPYVVFIVANWAVGVLLSGKGTMVHITKVVGYALYPACWLNLAGTFLSNFVTENEAALVSALFVFGTVLFFFYMFIGTIMVNQYSFTKNVGALLVSVVVMLVICFILMLFGTLLTQVVNDVMQIIQELMLVL